MKNRKKNTKEIGHSIGYFCPNAYWLDFMSRLSPGA